MPLIVIPARKVPWTSLRRSFALRVAAGTEEMAEGSFAVLRARLLGATYVQRLAVG